MEDLAVYESRGDIAISRPPEIVLAEAQKAAKALADVVSKKKRPVMMNGEQYLEFEDWQTVGRFYGVTAKIISTEYLDYGEAKGFQARAVAIRTDGMEISAAEAMCLSDEPNWKTKPLFQLRSMAQTRACAKALRNVLAWVVVLAGYRATPAEEIQDMVRTVAQPQMKQQEEQKEEGDDITIEAVVEKTSSKKGKKGGKEWTLYGVLAGGVWYNTFSKTLFGIADSCTGKKATITYQQGEKGKNLIAIQKEGCTGSPSTCEISTYDDEKAYCDDTVCMFQAPVEETIKEPW